MPEPPPSYQVQPIGWVRKRDGRTTIELYDAYRPVLLGVFATRAPMRPNLIALSRCRVLGVDGNVIEIDGIDAYADTPVLDIKP